MNPTRIRSFVPKKNAAVVGLALCVLCSPACHAQDGKDIAKGLLRALIESQLDQSRRRTPQPGTLRPQPAGITSQIRQLRPIAASYAQETNTLSALLRSDGSRSFSARQQIPAALRFEAQAAAVRQRVNSINDHALVLGDFRALNTNWATLAHRLDQSSDLSQNTRSCVRRIRDLDARYCSILGIQTQYDYRGVARSAYTLATYLRDLSDDIQHTPYQTKRPDRALLRELHKRSEQAEYLAGLAAQNSGFTSVSAEYQNIYQRWLQTEARLVGFQGHSIARNMRRIRDSHKSIHQYLRLPLGIDKNLVLHLIRETDLEISEVFRAMTLDDIVALPHRDDIPDAADVLSGNMENITDLVHSDEDIGAISEAWAYVEEAWNHFEFLLKPVRKTTIVTRLRDIDESLTSLQQALGVTVRYDRYAIVNSALKLETLAERLLSNVRQWQQRPGQHDRTLQKKTQQLVDSFRHIHQAATQGNIRGHLPVCDRAITTWQEIRPILKTCETAERDQINHIASSFTNEAVRLRTMLGSQ